MCERGIRGTIVVCLGLMVIFNTVAFAQGQSSAADFLFETGKKYYEQGNYEQALHEFKKALLVNPDHVEALMYIQVIEEEFGLRKEEIAEVEPLEEIGREEAVAQALEEAEVKVRAEEPVSEEEMEEELILPEVIEEEPVEEVEEVPIEEKPQEAEEIPEIPEVKIAEEEEEEIEEWPEEVFEEVAPARRKIAFSPLEGFDNFVENVNTKIYPARISGEYRIAMGVTSEDLIGKFADADLGERNWRYVDSGQKRYNSFDPAIFSRFRLDVQTDPQAPFDAYLSLVVDPWSFRGSSSRVDLYGRTYDVAEDVELKYFSSNRRAINENYRTIRGDSLGIPEMKVIDDWTTAQTRTSEWYNNFSIPALEIDREFMPIRKMWFDIGEIDGDFGGARLRVFPWASQEQALTTDDPLMLSNRHSYWEPSPWLWEWEQHRIFRANSSLKPGEWSDTLAFRARDSEGYFLTYLRGISLETKGEKFSLAATTCAPLDPWDDYEIVNNIPAALRLKVFPKEDLMLGSTYTFRAGFGGGHKDIISQTAAVDTEIKVTPEFSLKGEAAYSYSDADQTSEDSQWRDEDIGQAYKAEFSYSTEKSIISPDSLQIKLSGTYMGKDFSAPLSHYLETRDDMFWGKHISFSEPLKDYEPFRIGDGIDIDRYVGELDLRSKLFEEKLALLFNLRNVHEASTDKYIETVFRNEGTLKVNPKLTAKWLVINRDLPHTLGNYDPLIVKDNGEPFINYDIEDGLDPSTLTAGLGLKYDFTDKISLTGIYEKSNDLPDFPRALLNDIAYIGTETEGGITYDYVGNQLYQQGMFPLPEYDYFDIYKAKLTLRPTDDLTLGLNYTRNTFEYAGPVDDNVNHGALEVDYNLGEKWAFSFRYAYSKFIDVYRQNIGEGIHYDGHHNIYAEARYDIDENKRLRVQYGTFGYFNPAAGEYSTGWSLATVDTEHLFRIFLDGKF